MNIRKQVRILIIFFLATIVLSCLKDKNEDVTEVNLEQETKEIPSNCLEYIFKNKKNNLNISVLLDLSDRIEEVKTKKKDSAYLASLSKSFVEHVKNKKLILLEDRMQLFFNPEPSSEKINEIAEKLKIDFTSYTAKTQIEKTTSLYINEPSKLYNLAQKDAIINKGYPGSNIWGFFKDNAHDYCIDECHRNVLVILTDGYMYYDKSVMNIKNRASYLTPKSLAKLKLNTGDWKNKMNNKDLGFIPATEGLEDLEVLVIGITSHNKNPYAQDIIKAYWSKWFDEMGVEKYKIKNADIPSSIEKVISDFLLKQD